MRFSIHGTFRINRKAFESPENRKKAIKEFWDKVRKKNPSLPSACGCYLFAVRAAHGVRPWYVGLAEKEPFEKECFAKHKILIYNDVLKTRKGTPVIFLLARRTSSGQYTKPSKQGHQSVKFLESMLIGTALEKNPKLMNISKTKYLREMVVPSLLNSPNGRPKKAESRFRDAIK